jgi:hypothetical protein
MAGAQGPCCGYRLVAHFGWDDLIFIPLSARVSGPEQ